MITSKKYEVKSLKLNTPLRGKPAGYIVRIKVDSAGMPIEKYWRDRLEDSKIDGCIEFVKKKKAVIINNKKVKPQEDKGGKD